MFHEAGDHAAMDGRQGRVADVVLVRRQAEDHVIAQAQAFDAEQLGVWNEAHQRIVVVLLVGFAHQGVEIEAHAAPPCLSWPGLPMRMKAPTTWAMGWAGSSW
ncbi:hypothetical protein D9M68_588620 [compost metagenome]